MKSYILAALLALLALQAAAQFQVGDAPVPTGGKAGSLKDEALEQLLHSTTVFVVLESDADRLDAFRESLKGAWTITPFRVVLPDSAYRYVGEGFSLFAIGGYTVTRTSSSGMVTSSNTHLTYDLSVPHWNRKGIPKGRTILGRFALAPGFGQVLSLATMAGTQSRKIGKKGREEQASNEMNKVYRESSYANWGPGQIRSFVKAINDGLIAGKRHGMFDESTDKEGIRRLATDTLYLPESLHNKYSGWTGQESAADQNEMAEDTRTAYPFPHRYVSDAELEQLITQASRPLHYLVYVRSAPYKWVSVIEARSGAILYSRQTSASYNFKMKDLRALADWVD